MDCYYAQVEERDNPRYKSLPLAIGGPSNSRSVLSTANYVARKYGVRSAMSSSMAKKLCPKLLIIPGRYQKYKEISAQIRSIFEQYTDKIEPLSLDEAYLDVSHSCQTSSASQLAKKIRDHIFRDTSLTASAGIASNKLLAKIVSNFNKPNGQFTVSPEDINDFIKELNVKLLPGVGKTTLKKMETLAIRSCADLQKLSKQDLFLHFGNFGKSLYYYSRGEDQREVARSYKRKSFSIETTFHTDLEIDEVRIELQKLFKKFRDRLEISKINQNEIRGLVLKVKFFDFSISTTSSKEKSPSIEIFNQLLNKTYHQHLKPVRLIGLGLLLKHNDNNEKDKYQTAFWDKLN